MRSTTAVCAVAALLGSGCGATRFRDPDWATAEARTAVRGNNALALDLYTQLRQGDHNLFFSPYSISTALAMTYAGARGETQEQMAEVLHFDLPQPELHSAFETTVEDLSRRAKRSGVELSIANALWGQEGYNFLDSFLELVQTHYGTGLRRADFVKDTEGARRAISAWAERQTRGRISDLVPPGVLDELTTLVLVNAIYFKGTWVSPFSKSATHDSFFYTAGQDRIRVRMMHQTRKFAYAGIGESRCQVLSMPYRGGDLSMVIILPLARDGLGALEDSLTLDRLEDMIRALERQKVIVYLPKFKLETRFRLAETLQAMGMRDAFVYRVADFSGMDGTRELFVKAVLHKAYVDVYEEGTEAAAATAVVMPRCRDARPRKTPPVFRADHPFMFLIRDNRSGSILFMGRVVSPPEASPASR